MANEITAEMLAREVYSRLGTDYDGPIPSFWTDAAETFLSLTRALASLQAERAKDAPGRVRCWMLPTGQIIDDIDVASGWAQDGHHVTPG